MDDVLIISVRCFKLDVSSRLIVITLCSMVKVQLIDINVDVLTSLRSVPIGEAWLLNINEIIGTLL